MGMNLRSAVAMATIWLAAVVGVSATAWYAIDRAGQDITYGSLSPLSAAELIPPTPARRPAAAASPSTGQGATGASGKPTPSASPKPATPRPSDQTISVVGGLVTVRCTGATIELRVAQPQNNWRVGVDTSHPDQISVQFENSDPEEVRETRVTALCANGVPAFDTSTSQPPPQS